MGGLCLVSHLEGSLPPGRPESRAWLPRLLRATALASSCPGPGSESLFLSGAGSPESVSPHSGTIYEVSDLVWVGSCVL